MGNLIRIIELYEAEGVEEILKEKRLWSELEPLQQELASKSPEEREALEKRFNALLADLAKNADTLRKDMKNSKAKRKEAKKNAEACVSYTKASTHQDKK